MFGQIQISQTGDQLYSDAFPADISYFSPAKLLESLAHFEASPYLFRIEELLSPDHDRHAWFIFHIFRQIQFRLFRRDEDLFLRDDDGRGGGHGEVVTFASIRFPSHN